MLRDLTDYAELFRCRIEVIHRALLSDAHEQYDKFIDVEKYVSCVGAMRTELETYCKRMHDFEDKLSHALS